LAPCLAVVFSLEFTTYDRESRQSLVVCMTDRDSRVHSPLSDPNNAECRSEVFVMSTKEFALGKFSSSAAVAQQTELEDRLIPCIDCGKEFLWSAGEQAFFRDKRLENPPKRCKDCKKAKNERLEAVAAAHKSGIRQRIEVRVKCAKCGEPTSVPFYPSQGRPVYCRSCFLELNPSILNGNVLNGID